MTTDEATKRLALLGAHVMREYRHHYADLDGGWLEETLEQVGLIERFEVDEAQQEGCDDAKRVDGMSCECSVGDICFRSTLQGDTLKVLLAREAKETR